MSIKDLPNLVSSLVSESKHEVDPDYLWSAIRGALDPESFVNNLSEVLRMSPDEVRNQLKERGYGDLAIQVQVARGGGGEDANLESFQFSKTEVASPFPDLFSVTFTPPVGDPLEIAPETAASFPDLVANVAAGLTDDPFAKLYRNEVLAYHDAFIRESGPAIDEYIQQSFAGGFPKYIVNSGIGANEQFCHYMAALNNKNPERRCEWLIMNSPKQLLKLPQDASLENTLFMEFSRSGKTEETLKVHEYTPREAKRIVFSNSGPLREIGERDGNLVLSLPDEVSGRFGRNTTPILLAPMYVCGMDTAGLWKEIAAAIDAFDLSDSDSLPMTLAKFIHLHQVSKGINQIYLCCGDGVYMHLADELTQFWNEGVNKNAADILMCRYLGVPRDSHMNLEGILGNGGTKLAICLFGEWLPAESPHPLIRDTPDSIDERHASLQFGQEEVLLADANYERLQETMPTILVRLHGDPSPRHAAIVGQLWSDTTLCISRLRRIDPGSNPEVKYVRDRASSLLADHASSA